MVRNMTRRAIVLRSLLPLLLLLLAPATGGLGIGTVAQQPGAEPALPIRRNDGRLGGDSRDTRRRGIGCRRRCRPYRAAACAVAVAVQLSSFPSQDRTAD